VDDGSSDTTDEVIEEYTKKDSRFKYYHRPEEHLPGGNGARNYGFKMSRGEYVNWLDSDDLMVAEKLEIQISKILISNLDICTCSVVFFEKFYEEKQDQTQALNSDNLLFDFIRRRIVFYTPSVILRANKLKEDRLFFDEELKAAQEWEFFSRVLYSFENYDSIRKPLVLVRKHENSITYSVFNNRMWHYSNARLKVYKFLKESNAISLELEQFFKNYFMESYFRLITMKLYFQAFKILNLTHLKFFNIKVYIKAMTYLILKSLTGRGEFLKKYIF
jgi:glycosyltransferase involved in cell wall biosynthesis